MSNTGDENHFTIPSENRVMITVKNIPYDRGEHYRLGRRLAQWIFNSTTGAFWRGLAEYVIEEEGREYKEPTAGDLQESEKKRACDRRYKENHRKELATYNRKYRQEHREEIRAYQRRWYAAKVEAR